jgi:hypothetical protein
MFVIRERLHAHPVYQYYLQFASLNVKEARAK